MRFSTGVFSLDSLLKGGLPAGVTEIFGEDACGKTSLCLSTMREACDLGFPVAYIYTEGVPDKDYFVSAGPRNCVSVVPYFGEAGIEAAYSLLAHGARVVVIDTITSLDPIVEANTLVGEIVPYAKRKLVFHGLSVLREIAKKQNSLILVTSQIRVFLGSLSKRPRSSFSGTIDSLCDVRIKLRRAETRNQFGKLLYIKTEMLLKKSLVSPPNTKTVGFLFDQKGYDRGFELMRSLLSTKYLIKCGSYIHDREGNCVGQGYMSAAEEINKNFKEYRRFLDGS